MKAIHAGKIIDNSRFSSFHFSIIFWCFFIILMDGYDVVIYGSVVPSLIEEWNISSVTAGAIGSYTAAGTAVGAVFFGLLADKLGRKNVILLCTVLFSLFTALSAFSAGPTIFTVFRVIAGLGLGGVMPNVIALSTEYAPKKIRAAMVSFIFCGYSIGAIAAALFSKSILPSLGWQPVFWIAGLPLLLIPFIARSLPESASFLLAKGKEEKLRETLQRIDPEIRMDDRTSFEKPEPARKGLPLVKLFEKKRAISTIMFWISCFSCFVLIYAMNTWLPQLMIDAGYSLSSSLVFVAMMNVGAIVGTVVFGRLADKWGFKKVMVPLYIVGAIALASIGLTQKLILAYLLIGMIGAASVGVQNISNAFVSQYYPPSMRSTGIGAAMAFGRVGGIFAPTFVGVLLTLNMSPQVNFTVIAMAAVLGGVSILFVQEKHAYYNRESESHKGDTERKEVV
ncbi:MFS transporter, AAHS family, benzoate transport protein [Halobacillus dabanensis]|uniref:MFS transporter, AAHS family, benzoate transport protein n=1 Tax=Halobacillus dabanensis TaxID=240302 RepID=A0A1I3U1R8_HALDA|nr:aromatic acid/H+ symport family MFS transporter [Halobacillus dabanensis]SFJ76693.1 MFS transporter, AAHS family, benzoate transport protein [Halobacillus dabanensis]